MPANSAPHCFGCALLYQWHFSPCVLVWPTSAHYLPLLFTKHKHAGTNKHTHKCMYLTIRTHARTFAGRHGEGLAPQLSPGQVNVRAHPQLRHPQPTREGTAEIENRGQTNVLKQIEGEKWMRTLNCATHCPCKRALQKSKTEGKLMYVSKLKVKNGCAPSTAPPTAHARAPQKLKTEGKLMYLGKLRVKNGCAPSTAPSTAHARGHCKNWKQRAN